MEKERKDLRGTTMSIGIKRLFQKFKKVDARAGLSGRSGQSTIEYVLILVIVVMLAKMVGRNLQQPMQTATDNLNNSIGNFESQINSN